MGQTAKATRENRTITVDFRDEAPYFELIHDGKAFVELVVYISRAVKESGLLQVVWQALTDAV